MKEKNLNERKAKTLTILALVLLIVMVIGAAYAYFQAQVGNGISANINATTGTVDVLTFTLNDKDLNNEETYNSLVVDEETNTTDPIINIHADMNNFKEGNKSLGDGVIASANLKANNATNKAEGTYYVYVNITRNDFIYTQGDYKPELILRVKKPNGTYMDDEDLELEYIDNITLTSTENEEKKEQTISGFDITDFEGIIPIALGQKITITEGDHVGEAGKTEEYEIEVIFVNLESDQSKNAGKELKGKVYIQSEPLTLGTTCKDEEFASCMAADYKLDSFLIKHDLEKDNESENNYTLEAGDNSIRYTGGNAKIPEEVASQIVSDLYEIEQLCQEPDNCIDLYWLKTSENAETISKGLELYSQVISGEKQQNNLTTEEQQLEEQFYQILDSGEVVSSEIIAVQDAVKKGLTSNYEGIETLDNYVCVGDDCESGNLYRIIGSFVNEKGEYELKLIKESAGKEELGTDGAYSEKYDRYRWNSINGIDTDNLNKWADSNLNTVNLNDYFYNTYLNNNLDLKNMIVDHKWIVGGGSYENIEGTNAKTAYDYEVGDNKIKVGEKECYNEVYGEKIACTIDDIEYKNKIGLMYVSDYYYAADQQYWILPGYNNYGEASPYEDYRDAAGDDWLLPSYVDWTIARASDSSSRAFDVNLDGSVDLDFFDDSEGSCGARPVFYLASSVKLSKGEGSRENPFVLELDKEDFINLTVSEE